METIANIFPVHGDHHARETHLEGRASQLTCAFFEEEAFDLFLVHSLFPSFDFQ
jgi:hypothetical protein